MLVTDRVFVAKCGNSCFVKLVLLFHDAVIIAVTEKAVCHHSFDLQH